MTPGLLIDYLLPIIFIVGGVILAGLVLFRTYQAATLGQRTTPLSREDRVRIALARAALAEAARELTYAAWKDYMPGHPQVGQALLDTNDVLHRLDELLREKS